MGGRTAALRCHEQNHAMLCGGLASKNARTPLDSGAEEGVSARHLSAEPLPARVVLACPWSPARRRAGYHLEMPPHVTDSKPSLLA
mmetsp:Transcript_73775/g.216517  ORF Transcript_73775/g.216517 Transcript_73775/m.216517 type:complete len:86 (+) Transcript_73775:1285-1542(+)